MLKFNNVKKTLDDVVGNQKAFSAISKTEEFKDLTRRVNLVDYSTAGANFVSGFCFATNSSVMLPIFLSGMTLSGDYLHTKDFIDDTAETISGESRKKFKTVNKTLEYSRKGFLNVAAFYMGSIAGYFFDANK